MSEQEGGPSAAERERAEWRKLQLEIAHLGRMHWWEIPRAVAMILLAAAALLAVFHIGDLLFPPRPQVITVHFDEPLRVQLTK